ncbi:hypothetical protein PGT21_021539 [Puccinia graminis f. sp. tritici]|uniref:Uncharacterized protein n=1 Tax=Puccinia graminis f. sp. tritici TaxID=56615 RepID=A0A5B0MBK4_PUCGR|nr:hypothetical protein PGT21_021539 [Puccinia graminis f. sp. tritici]
MLPTLYQWEAFEKFSLDGEEQLGINAEAPQNVIQHSLALIEPPAPDVESITHSSDRDAEYELKSCMMATFYSKNSKIKEGTLDAWKRGLEDDKKSKQKSKRNVIVLDEDEDSS